MNRSVSRILKLREQVSSRRALALTALLAASAVVVSAPSPSNGTVDEATKVITYTGGPVSGVNTGPCPNNSTEAFLLTTNLPADFGSKTFKVELTLAANPADMQFTIRKPDGTLISNHDGPAVEGAEFGTIAGEPGITQYRVIACTFAGASPDYAMRIELVVTEGGGGGGGGPTICDNTTSFGGPDPTCVGVPRYQMFTPPDAASFARSSSGEANIGFNPRTRRIMSENSVPVARVTPAEIKPDGSGGDSGMPESCPELWENTSSATPTTLDPILWTSQVAGRTISSNQTSGANGAYAYTDDDGDTWIDIGLAVPSGGVDHQTITTGPFPPNFPLGTPQNHGEYALFCSQNLVGSVCQRSLTLGTSWENSVPATGPGTSNSQNCGGLHGHAKIAPDGSAWLPDESCGGRAGGGLSIDTSITPWSEFSVAGTDDRTGQPFASATASQASDPSIAFDEKNTIYFCYSNGEPNGNEVHMHMAVGRRTPGTTQVTWLRDTDLGVAHGIKNAVFPQAWGGSEGRAACGFLGTNVGGSFQPGDFPGDWYLFIATTYDEGRTWVTVNATPNDPVQHAEGVCLGGISCGGAVAPRNLLDFNEATIDDKGRFLFAFSDGCVSPGCVSRTAGNDNVADQKIVRQIGGKSLFASHDPFTDTNDGVLAAGPVNPKPVLPKRPCLLDSTKKHPNASSRDATVARLVWRAPDNGGVEIVNYSIYRSETVGDPNPTLIHTTADAKTKYDDTTVDAAVPFYYYTIKANTPSLASLPSNELKLQIGGGSGSPCTLPGVLTVYDLIDNADGSVSDDDAGGNTPPTESTNIKWISVAEPYLGTGVNRLFFTMQVGPEAVFTSPNSEWYLVWNRRAVAADGSDRMYVAMVTDAAGAPRFEYGNWGPPLPIGGVPPPNANTPTPLGLAHASSSYNPVTGTLTIVLDPSTLPAGETFAAGNTVPGLNARTIYGRYSGNPSAPRGQKSQNNASDITGNGNYTLVGNLACRTRTPPVIDSFEVEPAGGMSSLTTYLTATGHDDDSDAPADSIVAWKLNFGDGTSVNLTSPPTSLQHVYTTNLQSQQFTAQLTVTDSRGVDSVRASLAHVFIDNTPQRALTASPSPQSKGVPVSLDGSQSKVANDWTFTEFVFDPGDGSGEVTQAGATLAHAYLMSGAYTATLVSAKDSQGFVGNDTHDDEVYGADRPHPELVTVEITNTSPVADLTADASQGVAPLTVTFDGSASSDPDPTDYISTYDLDFGDGTPALTGEPGPITQRQHTYTQPGYYNVLLRVYDNELAPSGSDALWQIEVPNQPPVAAMTATPTTQGKNKLVSFDASDSSDAEGALLYAFDFGDGTTQSGTEASVTHAYAQAGVYTAKVTVTDNSLEASSAIQTVTITNAVPVAVLTASAAEVQPGKPLQLSGAGSSDSDTGDSVQTYTFTFGDGTAPVTQASETITHRYANVGTYEATLVVADEESAASDRQAVTVEVKVGDNTEAPMSQVLSGAPAPWMLGVLGLLGMLRRRSRLE